MHRYASAIWPGLLILLSLSIGCNPAGQLPTVPVRGMVTFDGQPVTAGELIFTPQTGRPAWASINSDGSFVLQTYETGDGAVVGHHQIAVIARDGELPTEGSPDAPVQWLVPQRYASAATSGLVFEVKQHEDNVVTLNLLP